MLKDFERKLRALFKDALKKGKFNNTFSALKTGDHYLELILHALHNNWGEKSSTLLYYMYDNQFIKTRKEFFRKRKSFDPDITMGLSILYDDYDMIQNNLSIEISDCDEISNLPWHQDSHYNNLYIQNNSIAIWASISDIDDEEGPVVYKLGSHVLGKLPKVFYTKPNGYKVPTISEKYVNDTCFKEVSIELLTELIIKGEL